jgi:hypothetical protein
MVLTKQELVASLQNEARILVHLIGKVEPHMIDYRPTPKQRSTIELLRYLSHMGPLLLPAIKSGQFDTAAWQAARENAATKNLDQISASIATLSDQYAQLVNGFSDADFRGEIEMFGRNQSRGAHIVGMVLGGHAAYRMQLFLYLKANGRDELNTFNLWGGVDGTMQATS